MKHLLVTLGLASLLSACSPASGLSPVQLADPMVGTGFHGHTFPGATTPFGAVQLSPDTRAGNWDACSGYHYSDSTINGFSHTHLSGTGCADLGDILFRPTSASIDLSDDVLYTPAVFAHEQEDARPGYYRVKLIDEDILAELSATTHVGLHRYTFAHGKPASIIVDLNHTLTKESVRDVMLQQTSDTEISGGRVTDGWTPDQHVYFTAKFSQPIIDFSIADDGQSAVLTFDNIGEPIVAAVGISAVSIENSLENLMAEAADLDFDRIASSASDMWNTALSVIETEGGTVDQLKNFYSALYHTMVTPHQVSDVNGQYRRSNNETGMARDGAKQYNTFSLWDTFRAWHPLMTIINPDFVGDMINSMLDIYDDTGQLPVWSLASGETGCMIGYHAVSVIADAYLKGISGFDADHALEAMVASTHTSRKGADVYATMGYIPCDSKSESVSCTLEYAYDDWCIARMAEALGRDDIARKYYQRARNYENVFDGSTKFFRGRKSDGNWQKPFKPLAASRDLTEATPWQYRFAAMHDVSGMQGLFGGREEFVKALDSMFVAPALEGEYSDITGMIGQYSHGNEPSHHIAYLYDYVGEPWKTQQMTRRLLDEMYQPTPDGLCGNEDCGQMSAWYIMSAMGLYQVSPGSNQFAITTPLFKKTTIHLPGGNDLVITANNPAKNKYIKEARLNDSLIEGNFIDYADIMKGGRLEFILADTPVMTRGTADKDAPYSMTMTPRVAMPYIERDLHLFTDSVALEIKCNTPGANIHYTLDGSLPTDKSQLYTNPVTIDRSVTVKAVAMLDGFEPSGVLSVDAAKAEYVEASDYPAIVNGVKYAYFEGNFKMTADVEKSVPVSTGSLASPSIDGAQIEDHFGFIFEGLIKAPVDGVYTFRTISDDGSRLFIDGHLVVNNDGGHSAVAASGDIPLRKGIHHYRLLYFENYDGQSLDWDWRLPEEEDFTKIDDNYLFIK